MTYEAAYDLKSTEAIQQFGSIFFIVVASRINQEYVNYSTKNHDYFNKIHLVHISPSRLLGNNALIYTNESAPILG